MMIALDILCIIFGIAMFILALYINAFWYKLMENLIMSGMNIVRK